MVPLNKPSEFPSRETTAITNNVKSDCLLHISVRTLFFP